MSYTARYSKEPLARAEDDSPPSDPEQALLELARAREQILLLEAASEAKSTFIAHMSHEIRTQLSGILGMTQVAMDTRLTPEQREYLELVRASGDALMTLVNDLLDLRKIESGRLELEEIPFSLRDTLADAVAVFAARAREKGLALTLDLASGLPEFVSGDPGRLRQVISNLVSNAIKFTDEGSVTVRAHVEVDGDSALFTFVFEDTGIGMTSEELARLFDEFEQGSRATARLYGGTGLGLAISRKLVERMGGSISVESAPVRGSRFRVEVPLRLAEPPVVQPRLRTGREVSGLPILVVANSAPSRMRIIDILGDSDLQTAAVPSLEEGLSKLEQARQRDAPYAAVILELNGDALDGARTIRERPEHDATHIVVITAVGQRGDAARCRELKVAGYLTEPCSKQELSEALGAVLGGSLPVDLTSLITRHWLRERRNRLDILVVDDSPTNRMSAKRLLETRGHSVFSVVTGREAIEALEAFRFDLVLMDLGLPEVDGLQAARAIRNTERHLEGRTPIIATTTDDLSAVRDDCAAAGMDSVVSKPFEPMELTEAIERVLS